MAPTIPAPKLSVVIPVYNELRWVETVLATVAKADCSGCPLEMIVVDDASTDGTGDLLQQLTAKFPQMRLFRQSPNQGKGAALRPASRRPRATSS